MEKSDIETGRTTIADRPWWRKYPLTIRIMQRLDSVRCATCRIPSCTPPDLELKSDEATKECRNILLQSVIIFLAVLVGMFFTLLIFCGTSFSSCRQ